MTQDTANKLQDFLVACREAAEKLGWGDQWNLCWYDSMLNSGGVSFSMNTLYSSNQNWFAYRDDRTKQVADHFFLNYNHGSGQITNAVRTAKSLGHSPFDVYTGQHIGTRGLGDSWESIMENEISSGTWGEHTKIIFSITVRIRDRLLRFSRRCIRRNWKCSSAVVTVIRKIPLNISRREETFLMPICRNLMV